MPPHRPTLALTALAAALLLGGGIVAPGAWAQPAPEAETEVEDEADLTQDQLDAVRRQLEERRAQEKTLSRQAGALEQEVQGLRGKLVSAAARVQDYEESLSYLENRMAELEREETALRAGLKTRNRQMAEVLTALQRLSWRPKETLLMQPGPTEDTVRSGLLLRSAIPSLVEKAEVLKADLARLEEVSTALAAQRDQIASLGDAFEAEHARLQDLVARKARLMEETSRQSQEAARQARTLAEEAETMKDFLEKLAEERRRREAELARQRALAEARQLAAYATVKRPTQEERRVVVPGAKPAPPPETAPESRMIATAGTGAGVSGLMPPPPRPVPAATPAPSSAAAPAVAARPVALRPLAEMRGAMPLPARGAVATGFGDELSPGNTSRGIVIDTRSAATVVAPADGVVAFSGPFRAYGHLLILEHAGGYHTLLSGMARIDARVGQRLLAGEPVGVMERSENPALYVELRRDGQPIDPLPWLAANKGKISG